MRMVIIVHYLDLSDNIVCSSLLIFNVGSSFICNNPLQLRLLSCESGTVTTKHLQPENNEC